MSRTVEDLVDECKQFIALKNKNSMERNPAVGKPSFLINKTWWRNYKIYVFYKDVNSHNKPVNPAEDKHPGQIQNDDILCDQDPKYLKGTGTIEQFETVVVDKYLKSSASERYDYKIINEDLWRFLIDKYGGSTIKRYSIPQGTYYTTVEVRLKQVPVVFLPVDKLFAGGRALEGLEQDFIVQLSKRKNYLDLKRRIVDCLNAKNNTKILETDVRLWKFSENKVKLIEACMSISQKENRIEVDSQSDPDLEYNSGVEFPGESLDPYYSTSQNLEDDQLDESYVIVEFRDSEHLQFAFQFRKNQRIYIGKCEFCTQKKTLKVECVCKRVKYCNELCQEKDKRWHIPSCSAMADAELQKGVQGFQRSSRARDGKVGLGNLGNTCYMNSSLQCLSNCYELTRYFLDERFKEDLNVDNPLGTSGRLVQAYAKLLNEMWNQEDSVVRPHMFKRILGEYAQQFQGFGQHDSQECINSILDLLSEDLYRKPKKPYVEQTEAGDRSDDVAAQEAWLKHLVRNESVIVDLFHGQYKSTLVCSICSRVSVTFDPFMTLSLPIPGKKERVGFFFVPYNITPEYKNFKGEVFMRESDTISDFRVQVAAKYTDEKFPFDASSFLITLIADNNVKRIVDQNSRVEDLLGQGTIILYQINPNLYPRLPPLESSSKSDSNYGVDEKFTKVVTYMMTSQKMQYSSSYQIRQNNIPRILWIDKTKSLYEVHLEVLNFFLGNFINLFKDQLTIFKKIQSVGLYTMEEFDQLSLEEKFQVIFPILNEENWQDVLRRNDLNIQDCLYTLRLKNLSGYMETCRFCGDKKCEGCPVPLSRNMTLQDFMMKIGIENNISFYTEGYKRGKNDVIFEIVWNPKIEKQFFDAFQTAVSFPGQKQLSQPTTQKDESSAITLQDCLEEFERPEMLDQDNMWYCNKCKEHVQATKSLKLFRLPLVLVINLKRFKHGKRMSMYGAGNGKLQTLVDFPLQGLDLQPHIIRNGPDGQEYIYDLFGVSNHFGGCGGGHYTAYALNWMENQWYSLDDSSCQKTNPNRVVSDSAYNLFYRRREKINLNKIDYDDLKQTASLEDLEQFKHTTQQ
eukprot:403345455